MRPNALLTPKMWAAATPQVCETGLQSGDRLY
jgi:hypothetical protein